jgi:hypothetical protein
MYEPKPNTGSLFINGKKNAESHPDFNGKLLVSRALLTALMAESSGDIMIELSAWKKTTKGNDIWLSLSCKEPYKKDALAQPPTPPQTQEAPDFWVDGGKFWTQFCGGVSRCDSPEKMVMLVNWVEGLPKPQPPRSQEIAQAIAGLIKKFDVPIPAEPRDLSGLISKIDVETQRSDLSKAQLAMICKQNFGKGSRALLSEAELCGLLEILKNWDEF